MQGSFLRIKGFAAGSAFVLTESVAAWLIIKKSVDNYFIICAVLPFPTGL